MKLNLKNYLDSRDKLREYESSPGPVVTISRAFGCDATPVARKLIKRIKQESDDKSNTEWKLISKELLEIAAQELKVNPLIITHLMDGRNQRSIEDLFSSFSSVNPYGVSNRRIINTLQEVITHYAYEGKTIIIGRGGAYVTQKIPNSLHIRLHAPLSWRIRNIQKKYDLAAEKAENMVLEMDAKRVAWTEHLINRPQDLSIFDVSFNRQKIDDETVIHTIISLMKSKKMIAQSHFQLVH